MGFKLIPRRGKRGGSRSWFIVIRLYQHEYLCTDVPPERLYSRDGLNDPPAPSHEVSFAAAFCKSRFVCNLSEKSLIILKQQNRRWQKSLIH